MNEQRKKPRLGELLVQEGLVTQDQLRIALIEQEKNKLPLGQQLVLLGFVTEAMIRDIVAQTIGQESVDLNAVAADAEAMKPSSAPSTATRSKATSRAPWTTAPDSWPAAAARRNLTSRPGSSTAPRSSPTSAATCA